MKKLDDAELKALDDPELAKKIRRCGGKKVLDDPELTKLDDTA